MTQYNTEKEYLANYRISDFAHPLTTVDVVIFTIQNKNLKVLLVKRAQFPFKGRWALPGGFIDLNGDVDILATAHRKLKEKTGVKSPYLEQVITLGDKKRDLRGWSVTVVYFALIPVRGHRLKKNTSSDEVAWVRVEDVLKLTPLAFDHADLLSRCHERLKSKVHYTSLPINLLPKEFTLTELQHTFEIIIGKRVEKKAFRRRILSADILKETGKLKKSATRPAKLYEALKKSKTHFFPRMIVPGE